MTLLSQQRKFKKKILANQPSNDREAIYTEAYFLRLRDALYPDFPKTFHLLGKKLSEKTIRSFISLAPSHYSSLSELASPFENFLSLQKRISTKVKSIAKRELAEILAENTHLDGDVTLAPTTDSFLKLNPSAQILKEHIIWKFNDDIKTLRLSKEATLFLSHFKDPINLQALENKLKKITPEKIENFMKTYISKGIILIITKTDLNENHRSS
jgi:hypothetical protein